MILLAFRHGLRVSELCALRLDMLDLTQGHLQVRRLKNGRPSVHTVRGLWPGLSTQGPAAMASSLSGRR